MVVPICLEVSGVPVWCRKGYCAFTGGGSYVGVLFSNLGLYWRALFSTSGVGNRVSGCLTWWLSLGAGLIFWSYLCCLGVSIPGW
ncbi:unnamed protein product [Amaranthus hypochondriacus]